MTSAWMTRVAGWRQDSVHRRVVSAAAIVASFTFAAKLLGAGKEVLVAHRFGTSDAVDAFLLAFTLPSFAISVAGTSLNYALMPAYVDVRRNEGPKAAQDLLSTTMAISVALLAGVSAVLALLVPTLLPLLAGSFAPEKLELTRQLSYLLLPSLLLAGTTTTWTAVLHAHGRFAGPSAAALMVPVVTIAALLALGRGWGIHAVAAGTLGGYLAEAVWVGVAVRREGLSLLPRPGKLTPAVRRVIREFAPALAGMLFTAVNPVIDQVMAARLGAGSVASLGYGNKLVAFAMGIGSVSVGSAILPVFSNLAAARDWDGLHRMLRTYAPLLFGLGAAVALGAAVFSAPLVRLLFERGAFTSADTAQVAAIQALYVAQIPFRMASLIFVRFIISAAANRVLMYFSIVNTCANATLAYALSQRMGAPGIALATSMVYALSCGMNFAYTRGRLRRLRTGHASEPRRETDGSEAALLPAPANGNPSGARVVLVVASLVEGGAERTVCNLAGHWLREGRDVHVLTVASRERDVYPVPAGVRRSSLDMGRPSRNVLEGLLQSGRRVIALRRALLALRPAVAVSFLGRTNVLTLLAALGSGIPVIVSERTDPRQERIGRPWSALRRLTYPYASAVVVQTESVAAWARKLSGRVQVIPNFVERPKLTACPEAGAGPWTLLGLGRLAPEKGFDLLLRAFGRAARSNPGWSLTILGDGPERQRLESLAGALRLRGLVSMPGRTADPVEHLAAAHAFVLPSRYEGFPNALLEAMACGLPVIAFDCPSGPGDIIRHAHNGILVPAGDVDRLAAAIRSIMRKPGERARMGRVAREVAITFAPERVLSSWSALLRTVGSS